MLTDASIESPEAMRGRAAVRTARAQTIDIRAPLPVRAYVQRIAARLTHAGHRVRIVGDATMPTPQAVDWLLYFERLAYRVDCTAFALLATDAPTDLGPCDLAIDLTGGAADGRHSTLRLAFDGCGGERGLIAALLDGTAPNLTISATATDGAAHLVLAACLAVEQPQMLASALDGVTPRLATLIAQAVERLGSGATTRLLDAFPAHGPALSIPTFAARAFGQKIMDRVARLVRHPDHWQIAVRTIEGGGVMERGDWSGPAWQMLRDDGRRYYADPFLFAWGGRRWLFCEEYPHATGKGILSVAPIDAHGQIGTPRPIIESNGHLSWPQVFVHEGCVYMIPESATEGEIVLWRADEFPMKWVRDRVLVAGVRAHDPLLHRTPHGAIILATLDDDGGSCWDALGLFSAPGLLGPWRANADNPLLVDASCARPAGPLCWRNGDLWRAVQDCRAGYGAALALCRVTRLDEGGFAQDVVTRLAPPPGLGARGVHTLSRMGDLEAIDLRGMR